MKGMKIKTDACGILASVLGIELEQAARPR